MHAHLLRVFLGITTSILLWGPGVVAQKKALNDPAPLVHYQLKVDSADLSGYDIEMHLQHAPGHFRLAMATHHEYDDRFWRFVRGFRVDVPVGEGQYEKKDSAVWDISIPGNEAVIRYRIQIPSLTRYAHRPFLSSAGGLVGDIHSFMYLVGQEKIQTPITFLLPPGWQIATGLKKTSDSRTFIASSAAMLMDCPVLTGRLREWKFISEGISYTIAYLPTSGSPVFDTAQLIGNIRKIVEQTVSLFGGVPYKDYTFQLEDGVYGALEHSNSVTIGAPASWLAQPNSDIYSEIAHEFSHTWNLLSIRPAEYTDLNFGPQQQSSGLWFSEGMAMFYADLLLRRAGIPTEDPTRRAHLERLITRYFSEIGNTVIAPWEVSYAANEPPGLLGDYTASTHLQGELLGAMLDLIIRNATDSRHSFDDVMQTMYKRFGGGGNGFFMWDVERAAWDVSGERKIHYFFQNYIYEGRALDFAPYLKLIGLELQIVWQPAKDEKGHLTADTRLYIWKGVSDTAFRLMTTDPASCWVKAGLHTGDELITINGQPVKERTPFNQLMKGLHTGDTVTFRIHRQGGFSIVPVIVTGYEVPVAHLAPVRDPGMRVQRIDEGWERNR